MAARRAYPPSPVAPWAEVVPDAPYPMTTDELHALPDDGWGYELVNGVLVRMPLSSFGASNVGMRLASRLSTYVEDNGLGAVTGEQGGYRLDLTYPLDTELTPDVAFVRTDRLPSSTSPDYYKNAPLLAPDLAVEVASENQYTPGMAEGQDLPHLRHAPGLGHLAALQARGRVAPRRRDTDSAWRRGHAQG